MKRHVTLAIFVGLSICASQVFADTDPDQATERAELRNRLAEQRKINLKRFHKYRLERVYPHNSYEPGMLNVWNDADGHLCAVATMMEKAGLHDLVERTGRDQNFVRVADIADGPLIDWVLTSGFTQEEIVMIQQPSAEYMEQMEAEERREKRKLARALKREDARLAKNYVAVERVLAQPVFTDAGLDVAVARLAARPDLVAALRTATKK